MVEYPVYVRRSSYRGHDRKKQLQAAQLNADASRLEDYVNKEIRDKKRTRFLYSHIAQELGMDVDRVREVLSSVDAGGNGFTVQLQDV